MAVVSFLTFGPIDTSFKKYVSQYTGLITIKIPISGTGSMYPTFPKGKSKTPQEQASELVAEPEMYVYPNPRFKIERGDIVEFKNAKTDEIETKEFGGDLTGFIKRIIGVPGDTIEIRDGQVLVNNGIVKEPYIALARSTFGGEFLPDCTKLKIPDKKYFVLGDNRKASNDSRHDVGLIDERDIGYLLPKQRQINIWDKNWRDISRDNDQTSRIKIDKKKYLEFLNSVRESAGLPKLKYDQKLEASAMFRGKNILKFNDFSFEATKSGYTMENSFSDSGYWNPIRGESMIQGYYTADELIEGLSQFKKSKGIVEDKQIEDIGIAEVEGEINGCPTQVIVQHFAGFVPPNYPQDQVESFRKGMTSLKELSVSWRSLKEDTKSADFYQKNKTEIDRINEIIEVRIKNLEPIVEKFTMNKWLSTQEEKYLKEDESLATEQNSLAERINKAIRDF